ncbi:carboxypeptidase-like regulatory domain-containing protein [Micromonospora sp. C28SCA-DRY-2]|uniref:carboxypeptidase-like regulatory domain-containing protein n=1 Tax=Micromonospora sp. C28SCA-DRY-2 TaxID=3059522 RepID=UPI002675EB59|nr:carboxypeptidase-like regulatory domain-containing protein [Micromonospora sp. C28SCA-DRY-2]MDO3703547.1 carboxypeptidase-like regulatory domain-containing protein [Micromonospora sp. C28SCA-DRY-2]
MTTRLPTRRVLAVAVTALAGATLAVPATAAPPTISILSVSAENVKSGQSVQVRFRATNNGSGKETVFVAVSGGLQCTAGCSASQVIGPGLSETFTATVVAPKVHESEVSGRNLAVSARIGTQTAFDHKMIFVHGAGQPLPADQPSSAVSQVSGLVRDSDGKPIGGARLTVRDSAGHDYRTTSGRDGRFSIKSSASKPVAVGLIRVEARKDGYRTARATVRGATGGAATVRLTLAAVAPPSSPSAAASLPGPTEEPATEAGSAGAAPPATLKQVSDEGGSSPLWIILGGLLVAAGSGGLVLALIRRRNALNEPNPPALAPNRVDAPVGGSGAGMADAPTAVLCTVPPDGGFSDPYGAATQGGNQQHGYHHGPYDSYSGPVR